MGSWTKGPEHLAVNLVELFFLFFCFFSVVFRIFFGLSSVGVTFGHIWLFYFDSFFIALFFLSFKWISFLAAFHFTALNCCPFNSELEQPFAALASCCAIDQLTKYQANKPCPRVPPAPLQQLLCLWALNFMSRVRVCVYVCICVSVCAATGRPVLF